MTPDPIPAHVPTTEQVRVNFQHDRWTGEGVCAPESGAEFDAWLARHDADVRAHVLNAAADALNAEQCEGRYNPDACETCRAVESLRESAIAQTDPEGDR